MRSGFTLMELLGAIAIMAIVAALAVPAAVSIQSNLEMTRLDETAKQVYMAAQQRVSSLQSTGELKVRSSVGSQNVAGIIAATGQSAGLPADYTFANRDDNIEIYYVRDSDDVTHEYLITSDGLATSSGHYFIELSPYTGEVYSAIYWEDSSLDALSYQDIAAAMGDRSRAARLSHHIGYYGGNELQVSSHTQKGTMFKDLKFQLVNWEDLYVKLSSKNLQTAINDTAGGLSITVDVVGTGSGEWKKTFTRRDILDASNPQIAWGADSDGKGEVDILLDSMYGSGLNFASLTGGKIATGSNITVSVSISYDDEVYDKNTVTGMGDRTDNSAFDSLSYASNSSGTVKVSCLRHLNNLRSSSSYQWTIGTNSYNTVIQTRNDRDGYLAAGDDPNIDFNATHWQNGRVALQHLSSTSRVAASGAVPTQPVSYFTPLTMNTSFDANTASISGKDASTTYTLENFVIGDAAHPVDNTGLFATAGFSISGVRLVDVQVHGASATGALVGATGSFGARKIDDCHVYGTVSDGQPCSVTGSTQVGGLVGSLPGAVVTNSSVDGCAISATATSGNGYAGGFAGTVGNQSGLSISGCSVGGSGACTVNASVAGAGGFTGNIVGGNLSGCSVASTTVYDAKGACGGFSGSIGNSGMVIDSCSVSSSSASAAAASVGGFAGIVTGGEIDRSTVDGTDASTSASSADSVGGFIGSINGWPSLNSCSVGSRASCTAYTPSTYAGGFVGSVHGGTITGCSASSIDVWADKGIVGGFAGILADWPTITSSSVGTNGACSVSAQTSYAGGFAGQTRGTTMDSCSVVSTDVSASQTYAGGFGGDMQSDTVTGCTVSSSTISAEGGLAGGFAGMLSGWPNVKKCGVGTTGACTVLADGAYAGGFAGIQSSANVSDSYAVADVGPADDASLSSTSYFGGFAGRLYSSSSVTYCFASGSTIRAYSMVGGFAGSVESATTQYCYTTSNVVAYSTAGGFAGKLGGSWYTANADVSYGSVLGLDGKQVTSSGRACRGFAGSSLYSLGGSNCYYLRMSGYNDQLKTTSQPTALGYAAMQNLTAISSTKIGRYPFSCIVDGSVTLPHKGGWPNADGSRNAGE
jgi:prepilin-type N-terminal cleavage/methylation domain-containing protein